jgi:hypothetical protein
VIIPKIELLSQRYIEANENIKNQIASEREHVAA